MDSLYTPLGLLEISLDGQKISYKAKERKIDKNCPDLLGRYQIEIDFTPDGKQHQLSCVIDNKKNLHSYIESGENLECQSFISEDKVKLSIGLSGEQWGFWNGKLINSRNDYDIEYLEKGMSYIIFKDTKTSKYKFGISWIDNIGFDESYNEEFSKRDVQTWFGSEPDFKH